jgi:hypothetical protein
MILPEERQPALSDDVLTQWLDSDSLLLLISGVPGAGKSTALSEVERLAGTTHVEIVDDFPRAGQGLSDISLLLQGAAGEGRAKLAMATQIRAHDPRTGITSYLMQNYGAYDPWVVVLEPIAIHEIADLAQSNSAVSNSVGIQTLLRLDRSGRDTRFLRTPGALVVLLEARAQRTTISAVVEDYVTSRLMSAKIQGLNPTEHANLLSRLCFQHFLGMGDTSEPAAQTELEGVPERAVSLEWLEQRLRDPAVAMMRAKAPEPRMTAEESPFLTFQLETPASYSQEVPRVILPDTLSYEYFVARGLLNAVRADDRFQLARRSLGDLSDGMVEVFIQAKISPGDFPRLASACQRADLSEPDRMLFLHLLEDWPTFGTLLRESPVLYHGWLEGFVGDAPNVFCWKVAAFQLLALGKFELEEYLTELRTETPEDRSFESELLSLRGAGDISRLLIERMKNRDLRRCRGVTAVRMGRLGSLQCVIAIGEAIADEGNTPLEIEVFLQELARLVVRHSGYDAPADE